MAESDDDWSLHDIDRVPEPPVNDAPLSPRTSYPRMASMSSRRSTVEAGSSSSLHYNLPEGSSTASGRGPRFQRRGWGSSVGGGNNGAPPTPNAASPPAMPPSLNLEAVMSFPPMSEEHIALSNTAEQRRRSSTNSIVWSGGEARTSATTPKASGSGGGSNSNLHNNNSFSGQSLTGGSNSLASNSLTGVGFSIPGFTDESISENVDDENISLGKAPPMPLHKRTNNSHHNAQQSVTTGLTPQQRARFDNLAAPRPRLGTGGSSRSRRDGASHEKPHDLSENNGSSEKAESRRRLGSLDVGSDSSWVDETDHEAGEDGTEAGDSTIDTRKVLVLWGGLELPYWLVSWFPSLHRISTWVVTRSPCFFCWGFRQPTDRTILSRLNILLTFVTLIQVASAVFLASATFNKPEDDDIASFSAFQDEFSDDGDDAESTRRPVLFNVWTTNVYIYLTGMLAFINLSSAVLTIRVIRNVNLVGAIRYLWVLLWLLPLQFQSNIGLFDYFRVTDVWIKHYWRDSSMSWFRERFCDPTETADLQCVVPRGNETQELAWCQENFNSTNCSSIRNSAQSEMERWILTFYYLNASVGLVLICLLFLTVNLLEHIISKPLVQKSRESNVPAWMSLPIVTCVAFGLVFAFSSSSVLNTRTKTEATWIGPLFLVTAALFFMAAMIGWYISAKPVMSTRHKRNKLISIWAFIILMACILVLLMTIFGFCIAFSVSLVEVPISQSERGDIACFLDESASCTLCDSNIPGVLRCPEWSVTDVTKVIQTQAKASASLAAMLMLYALSALRFGIGLRTHIRMYQIDYI